MKNRNLIILIGLLLAAFFIILSFTACDPEPPTSPLPTPTVPVSPSPTPTPTAVVISPLPTPAARELTIQIEPTSVHFSSGAVEIYCDDPGAPDSPLRLEQPLVDEIAATLELKVQLQIRQDGVVVLEQGVPTYLTMQQFGPTTAPNEPCTGLFKRIEYDWRTFNPDLSGDVDEWVWLYWQPVPVTATLYISDTWQLFDPDNQKWYLMRGGEITVNQGYTYHRSFEWGYPEPQQRIYLPLVLRNAN